MAALGAPWSSMRLLTAAKYLGAIIGPTAGATCWADPMKKWRARVDQMSAAQFSATSRMTQYRLRALPVLAYTAQIRPAPNTLPRLERVALERLLKMPHNAVPSAVLAALPEVGVPAPPLATCLGVTALARTAARSSVRQRLQTSLDAAREEHLPLAAFAVRRPHIPGWDNSAIVDNWAEVLDGTPTLPAAASIVEEVLAAGGRGLQARLLEAAVSAARPTTVLAALHPRVTRFLVDAGLPPVLETHFGAALRQLPGSPSMLAVAALRTWVGAWSTPTRQQHEPGGCPFGCSPPATGSMTHLIGCATLWSAAATAIDAPHVSIAARIAAIPSVRIARRRSQGSMYGLMVNAIAVEAYHRRRATMENHVPAAQRLAKQLTVEAARHLLPLRMRPKRAV